MITDRDLDTIRNTSVSRRTVFKGAGVAAGLTIFWKTGVGAQNATPAATPVPAARPTAPTSLDAYLRINEDGTATVLTGKIEYGQGIQTGFVQIIAEELSLPFESVTAVMGQTDAAPFDIGTFGSLSTQFTGPRLRQAGAGMRIWLTELGAEQLGLDISEVGLVDGTVASLADPAMSVTYAELAFGQQTAIELDPNVALKDPATYTVIGASVPRPDVAQKVNGELIYGIDATVEGMVWGKIVRPTGFGFTLAEIDFSAAEAMPGVVGTFRDGDFAGIAAETLQQVEAAHAAVTATWVDPQSPITSENIHDTIVETADAGRPIGGEESEDESATPVPAPQIANPIQLTYKAPYVCHTPIEPRNSVVQITPERVDVYASTQDPWTVRSAVAEITGHDLEAVVVTPLGSGGAFGSKVLPMADIEAARLAVAIGRPVKILWSRAEELAQGQYRPAMQINLAAGLDDQGTITGWNYDLFSSAYFPATAERGQGAAADWAADTTEVYAIPTARTMWYQGASPLPPYFWRVNGATTNTWARESTMDVLAETAGLDPVTFRMNHLAENPRMAAVLEAVVAQAGWTPGVGSTGQGIGLALGFDANTCVAQIARVEVDQSTGQIMVRHVDAVVDCGLIINPEAVSHQIEGSIVMGTSSALREQTLFANGIVSNPSFAEYAPITMRETPSITVSFVEDKTRSMGGVGEPGVAPITGAIANAFYDLTGVRLFDTPFLPEKVLAAMQAGPATPVS